MSARCSFQVGSEGSLVPRASTPSPSHRPGSSFDQVFTFKRPWRWIAEPMLRRWLEGDTAQEMVRFKELVERGRETPRKSSGGSGNGRLARE